MNKLFFAAGISLSLLSVSCGDKPSEEIAENVTTETPKDTTPITVNEETKFKFDFAIANIPSPVGSINELSGWGVDYNNALLVDSKKQLATNSEFSKAVALGIYNIDMSYAMVNNKGEDVLKYMKTVVKTSDELGLKNAVDQMVGKRAEKNLGNKDSLLTILDEIFIKSDSYLRTNERVYTASAVFAGSWVESLYLTCKIAEGVKDPATKEKAYKHLWDQRFYLKNLTDLLNDYKDKKECVALNDELKKIHADIDAIKDPKDLKDADFKKISEKIYALRASLMK
ncbi:MAG: hypothetical protein K0S53_1386 [Bacteroidetes bacterium]|jgi:hypothetical protein|nr:hypothetical protein [Bacteroidota bacterium]MDF2453461.1 hypothetical protein [Bacteroidota bacterium]